MSKIVLDIDNCIDCPNSQILPDPDPFDWFCDDDKKVICKAIDEVLTCACRPYNLRKECEIPKWCPRKLDDTDGGAK